MAFFVSGRLNLDVRSAGMQPFFSTTSISPQRENTCKSFVDGSVVNPSNTS